MSGNKFKTSNSSYHSGDNNSKIFHIGVVESVQDINDTGRIKVRIKGVDDHITEVNKLPHSFPLLQKFIHITPKVGESVWCMFPDNSNPFMDRLYIGPIISQPQNLEKDPHAITSTAGLDGAFVSPNTAPSTLPESRGVYPNKNDIAIQGRKNNDILFKDNEIQIRVGKYSEKNMENTVPKFNKENPTYIQLKQANNDAGGVINLVGNKINILGHDGGNPRFNLADPEGMISNDELANILDKAHPLVFGDLLIEYLNLFKEAFINHVHPYDGMRPEDLKGINAKKKFLEFDVEKIISKNIRIN
jgi:hypothetical protein